MASKKKEGNIRETLSFYPLSSRVLSAIRGFSCIGYDLPSDSFTILYLFLSLHLLSLYSLVLDVTLKKKVCSLPNAILSTQPIAECPQMEIATR